VVRVDKQILALQALAKARTFAMNHIRFKEIASLGRVAFQNWQDDRAPRMGAALAYYIALSLAPSVLILLGIAGLAFGAQAAEDRFVAQIQGFVGHEGAKAIQTMIEGTRRSSRGVAATILGLATVFFAASAVVSELRDAMNTIWKVPSDTTSSAVQSIVKLVKDRLLSFTLVLASGLFLVASLIGNAWMFAAGKYLNSGDAPPEAIAQSVDWVVSFVVITCLFAFIFKVLPRVPLQWRDVVLGAVATSLLFSTGKILLGLYLGKAGFTNTYGAAGSLIVILVWVYYSAQVLFLGAEFTRAYACRFGSMCASKSD
jgi:membrane protein